MEKRTSQRAMKYRSLIGSLSPACSSAISTQMANHAQEAAKLAVDWYFDCHWGGEHTAPCIATNKKIESFDDLMKKECAASGDLCTVTHTTPEKEPIVRTIAYQ